jgi:large subunit ribosomal protein L15
VVSRASASAIAAVEKAGGTVTTRYYTAQSIKRITSGLTDPLISLQTAPDSPFRTLRASQAADGSIPSFRYRLPDPASRKDLEYYRDPAHRGYLSYLVSKGEGPSLYIKTPAKKMVQDKEAKQKEQESKQNRLW